jgi:endonuclease/exonuclease/phosphatase family metal-dependent hydrolase
MNVTRTIVLIFCITIKLFASANFSFSIANYNVQNLFDDKYDKTEYDDYVPNRTNWNKKTFQIKLKNISKVLNDMDCDIVALQEIENQNTLNQLLKKLPKYKYSKFVKDNSSAIGVAVISRFPIINYQKIDIDVNDLRIRPILKVTIQIKQSVLDIFINHWASKRAKESHRVLSAYTLLEYIKNNQENEYIILGDLNENYNEYQTIKSERRLNNTYGITAINDVLFTTQKINNQTILCDINSLSNGSKVGKCMHYNTWLELPIYDRFSYKFKGNHNTPDNILLPKNMFDDEGVEYVQNSFVVFRPKYLYSNKTIHRWLKNGKFHKSKGYSDHLPIMAKFKLVANKNIFSSKKIAISNTNPKTNKSEMNSIDRLYEIDALSQKLNIKNAIVIYKNGENAIIKQLKSKAIYLYGCASSLKEGYMYDLSIDNITNYQGLKEVKNISNIKQLKSYKQYQNLYIDASKINNPKYQNEIITNLTGIYKKHKLYIDDDTFTKLYFKDKTIYIEDGSKITIRRGHLATYKGNIQIIIHDINDITKEHSKYKRKYKK